MLTQIARKLIAHKAGIAMGAAMVGVVVTAVCAIKDHESYEEEKERVANEREGDKNVPYNDADDYQEGVIDYNEFYNKVTSKKEKVIIFAKTHWKTGMSMAVTFGLMVFSHHAMAKEVAATAAALGIMSSKYKELAQTLKEKYPEEYEKVMEFVDEKNIRKEFSKNTFKKEETYDGRQRYYEEFSNQIFYATEAQIKEAECAINERVINTGECNLFTYLATFPKSSGIKLYDWMKHIGWYEGDTMYSDVSGYIGSYIKPEIVNEPITFEGETININKIRWSHCLDFEPELDENEVACLEAEMDGIPA